MAEILGAVAGGISIGGDLIRLGCAIQRAIKKIKDSRRDIEKLATETIIFAGVFKRFLASCNEDPHAYTSDTAAVRPLIKWAQKTIDGLTELLDGVEALQPQSKIRHKWEGKAIARLVWFTSTNRVKSLRASLRAAQQSINGFSNLMYVEALRKEIRMLRQALNDPRTRRTYEEQLDVTVETRMEELRLEITQIEVVHRENKTILDRAIQEVAVYRDKSKTSSEAIIPDELIDLTKSLDEFAREILPTRAPSRRSNSSASAASTSTRPPVSRNRPTAPSAVSLPSPSASRSHVYNSDHETSSRTSTLSRSSTASPAVVSTSVSEVSSASDKVVPPRPRPGGVPMTDPTAGAFSERIDSRAREYINDPNGNILSPPILREHSHPFQKTTIGRHAIVLDSTSIKFNNHEFKVETPHHHNTAALLYSALIEHKDKLDELDQVLRNGYAHGPGWEWRRIPGWEITPRMIRLLPSAPGTDASREAGSAGALRQ